MNITNKLKKIILFSLLLSNPASSLLTGNKNKFYLITKDDLANLKHNPGETTAEFVENNIKFFQKMYLYEHGLEDTPENIEKLEQEQKHPPIDDKPASSLELISAYKMPIAIGSFFFSSYFYLLYKLHQKKQYINKSVTWSCFKKNVPIDILHEIPEDKVLQELTEAIYRTYSEDEDHPDYNDMEPFYLFLKATQKEMRRLESFVNLYWYLKLPGISLLFPNYDDELLLAQEKIDRLYYMHNLISDNLIEINS